MLLQTLYSKKTLMDGFDYVMHGKIFRFKDRSDKGVAKVDVSETKEESVVEG